MTEEITFTSEITVDLLDYCASDYAVARAARVSTSATPNMVTASTDADGGARNAGLIARLMRDKHGSPFEQGWFQFRVHMPLEVATEHLRHRSGWSYNGESGRYKVFSPTFYVPGEDRPLTQIGKAMDYNMRSGTYSQRHNVEATLRRHAERAWGEYQQLLADGISREVARKVLPLNTMTTYITSCNPRSLMHFLSLRTPSEQSKPMYEIVQVARGYERALAEKMPATYAAFNQFGRVAP